MKINGIEIEIEEDENYPDYMKIERFKNEYLEEMMDCSQLIIMSKDEFDKEQKILDRKDKLEKIKEKINDKRGNFWNNVYDAHKAERNNL